MSSFKPRKQLVEELMVRCKIEEMPFRGKHSKVLHTMDTLLPVQSFEVPFSPETIRNCADNWDVDRTLFRFIKQGDGTTRIFRK